MQSLKAQVFSLDLILGVLITTAAIITALYVYPNHEDPLSADSERVAILMSDGVPSNWTVATLIIPGFLSYGRFNQTKIVDFASLSPSQQKTALGIQSDFTITFSQNGTVLSLCSTCGSAPASYDHLLAIRRYGILGSNITTMEVNLYK